MHGAPTLKNLKKKISISILAIIATRFSGFQLLIIANTRATLSYRSAQRWGNFV